MSEPKCRILYVDDHEDSAEMFRLLVSSPDFDVQTAPTVAEALELAKSRS